jgi:hypothetical protein
MMDEKSFDDKNLSASLRRSQLEIQLSASGTRAPGKWTLSARRTCRLRANGGLHRDKESGRSRMLTPHRHRRLG